MLSSPLLFIKSTVRRRLMWTRPLRLRRGEAISGGSRARRGEMKNLFTVPRDRRTCRTRRRVPAADSVSAIISRRL